MNIFFKYPFALPYTRFMLDHGNVTYDVRWRQTFERVQLTPAQRELLRSFKREMNVLVYAGAWCGDCAAQCPIFDRFVEATPVINLRYLDRDSHPQVQRDLLVNGGQRVPVVIFFSEDGHEVARYGDRTLSRYRALMAEQTGAAGPTGITLRDGDALLAQVTQDWLNEFERVQWLLRLSPRLRKMHGD